jgi:hypothetical protein
MKNLPSWFNPNEYSNFLTEAVSLFEFNAPYWKERRLQQMERRQRKRTEAIRDGRERAQDQYELAQAKADGIARGFVRESFKAKLSEDFLKLMEASNPLKKEKRKMRPEVDPADRDRDRKREDRREANQSPLSNILIVRNKNIGKLEIITRDDYNQESHELLKGRVKNIDKGSISKNDLIKVSQNAEFMNTKTSMRLIGKVEKQKEDEQQQEQGGTIVTDGGQTNNAPPPPPTPRAPQDGKEITTPTSTYSDWDHKEADMATGIVYGLNSVNTGEEMPPDFAQLMSTSRTLGDSINRAINGLLANSPILQGMQFQVVPPVVNTGQNWGSNFEIPQSKPTASLIGISPTQQIGVSIKIGEQIRPTEKTEANAVFNATYSALPDASEAYQIFPLMLTDMFESLRKTFSSTLSSVNTGVISTSSAKLKIIETRKKKEEFENSKNIFKNRVKELIEVFINDCEDFKSLFLLECLSGSIKFEDGLGSAQLMMSMEKDGTNAEIVPIDLQLTDKLAKSDQVYLTLKFIDGPIQPDSYIQGIYQKLLPLNESAIEAVVDLEKIRQEIATPIDLMNLFEIQIADITYRTPVRYGTYFEEDTDGENIVILNPFSSSEKEVRIPVDRNYNLTGEEENVIEKGADQILQEYLIINDYLADQINTGSMNLDQAFNFINEEFNFLAEDKKERNYRKEYDEYHGTAEQRANRSKRVLARRKMMKKGRVRKGDGKDVDHKNGNPKDNSDGNLRVLSKSKNRSIKEDHGAGFDATPEFVEKLKEVTPHSESTPVLHGSKPYVESKPKNKKK